MAADAVDAEAVGGTAPGGDSAVAARTPEPGGNHPAVRRERRERVPLGGHVVPVRWGFLSCVAVMDWITRKVVSCRVSNTMDAAFGREALAEALTRFGRPELFNTNQGSQFTSPRLTTVRQEAGVHISMDGRGRWMDNIFIERL